MQALVDAVDSFLIRLLHGPPEGLVIWFRVVAARGARARSLNTRQLSVFGTRRSPNDS